MRWKSSSSRQLMSLSTSRIGKPPRFAGHFNCERAAPIELSNVSPAFLPRISSDVFATIKGSGCTSICSADLPRTRGAGTPPGVCRSNRPAHANRRAAYGPWARSIRRSSQSTRSHISHEGTWRIATLSSRLVLDEDDGIALPAITRRSSSSRPGTQGFRFPLGLVHREADHPFFLVGDPIAEQCLTVGRPDRPEPAGANDHIPPGPELDDPDLGASSARSTRQQAIFAPSGDQLGQSPSQIDRRSEPSA